ncbi:MAG TPA: LptA/OstA family protein, partial [Longimicrobium sp.]|nr:LptA/OstA family protein [Longimicrobium sp.]
MRRLLLPLAALLALALPAAARAQGGPNACELVRQQGNWQSIGDPANRVISAQGPLLVRCSGGEELRADSAVIYQTINEVHLFRQVDYQDATRALTSDQATYNSQTGRLYATGNVVFTDKTRGTTLRGPELEYFKAMAGRPEPQAIATQRPHLTIVPKSDRGGRRRSPMEVDADRVTSVGERYVTAEGNVVIVSDDVRSTAAEAFYDSDAERTELRRQAFVDHKDYDLSGDYIETTLKEGVIQKVIARTDAHLVSEKLDVRGPQLQLFFERELLQRMISSNEPGKGSGRSIALAKGFRMEADSIEALSPEQKLRQVNAVGAARGESWDTLATPRPVIADSAGRDTSTVRNVALRPATEPPAAVEEKDLLLADTIVGFFR